jgi:hypothetical protein
MYKISLFYALDVEWQTRLNAYNSTMYKILHKGEKKQSPDPLPHKGSGLFQLPLRYIMLTNFAYHIQSEKEKNYPIQ